VPTFNAAITATNKTTISATLRVPHYSTKSSTFASTFCTTFKETDYATIYSTNNITEFTTIYLSIRAINHSPLAATH